MQALQHDAREPEAGSTADVAADEVGDLMGANADALEKTIGALQGLTDEHAALVEHARTLADLLDLGGALESKLHGEYRQVLARLELVGKKKDIDAFEQLLQKLRGDDAARTDPVN